MKRKFLEDLGLEKEAIDKIMDENGKDIESAKGDSESLSTKIKDLESEKAKLEEQINERDGQLKALRESAGDNQELKDKIAQLEKDNKDAADKHSNEMAALRKNHAIESALTDAKAKSIKAIMPFIDTEKVSIDGGNVIGLTEQIDKLKEAEDTKFLFDSGKPKMKGAEPGQPGDEEPDPPMSEIQKRIAKYKK